MNIVSRTGRTGVALAVGVALLLPASPAAASNDGAVSGTPILGDLFGPDPLPLPGFADMAVGDGGHVFVTGGESSNSVVVAEHDGDVEAEIGTQYGASGLALSEDGSTLYVALASGDAISAIDTATLEETARYATGAHTCPTTLARTGDLLWFGYGCGQDFGGGIGKLDTSAASPEPTTGEQGDAVEFFGAPLLAAPADDATTLVAGQPDLSPATVTAYTVSDGDALVRGASGTQPGSGLKDLAVTPDGATLFTAAGSADHVKGLTTADLAGAGAYDTRTSPHAAAVSPDGAFVAVGRPAGGDQVFVYGVGEGDPERDVRFGGDDVLARGGLAWTADGERLFAVTTSPDDDGAPTLRRIAHPTW